MSNGTNVPPITFNLGTGFVAPSGPAILAGVQADINAAFGGALNFALNTPQGQLASSWAAVVSNADQLAVYLSQQMDPNYASGRFQDGIGAIYFLQRMPAVPTSLMLQLNGLTGVTIPIGALVQDPSGVLYACTGSATIGGSGTVTAIFAAILPGPTPIPQSVSIYQAIPGWDSAGIISGAVGSNTESRAAFEQRRFASVAVNSVGPIGAIIGAVATITGVVDYYGQQNATGSGIVVNGVSIPANAIYICVAGGDQTAIAQAILTRKGAGAPMAGNTTVQVFDSNPLYPIPIPYSITFQRPSNLQVLFNVQIKSGINTPANYAMLIQSALLAAFTGQTPGIPRARIGQTLYATTYVPAVTALGSWAQITSMQIGSANVPGASAVGSITGNTLTITSLSSGTIAVGQFVTGTATGTGAISAGTQITSLGTGVGGTGTYLINAPTAQPSQTLTFSSANQTLVAVAINQEPILVAPNIVTGLV